MSGDDEIFHAPPGGFRLPVVHPGGILGEELETRGISAHAFALKLRVPANRITEIVNGKRGISAETALRLGRYFGNPAEFWMRLQAGYDLAVAERDVGERVLREVEVA
jgi:addiction module HigA family antidote